MQGNSLHAASQIFVSVLCYLTGLFLMFRMFIPVLLAGLGFASAAYGAAPPIGAGDELFTISGIKVEASAESPRVARDLAMAQGRSLAWSKMLNRLTDGGKGANSPRFTDKQLLGLIRSVKANNERHNTRRYLADLVFSFNPGAVRQLLRTFNIDFIDTRAEPALVIPLTTGTDGFDPTSPWAMAWADPALRQGLVPMLVAEGGATGLAMPKNITQLDWAALEPMANRYGAGQVILAIASDDAKTIQTIAVSPLGRTTTSFAFAQSTFAASVEAVVEEAAEEWKQSIARLAKELPPLTGEPTRNHLMVNVQFGTPRDVDALRARLSNVDSVSEVDVIELTPDEARIDLTYIGDMEALERSLARQYLELSDDGYEYWLDLGTAIIATSR
jgi:hypothetical protein